MKKTLMILSMLLGVATFGFAQNGGQRQQMKPEDRAKPMAENLQTKLKLDEGQKNKVYDISLQQSNQMDSLRKAPGEMKEKFPKTRAIMEAGEAKIDKVLNDDQRKAYAELKAERRKNWDSRKNQQN
ncbi:MAG: hypothetical protein ACOH2A_05600 [Sphingobacteriaceae bacterium]